MVDTIITIANLISSLLSLVTAIIAFKLAKQRKGA